MKCTCTHKDWIERVRGGKKKNDAFENLVNIWYIESHTHCDLNGEFKNTEKNYTKYLIVQWMAPKPKQYQMRSGEK